MLIQLRRRKQDEDDDKEQEAMLVDAKEDEVQLVDREMDQIVIGGAHQKSASESGSKRCITNNIRSRRKKRKLL